jgi:hypothetical protein
VGAVQQDDARHHTFVCELLFVCLSSFALLLLIWQSPEIKIKSQRREEINNHTEFDNGRYHIV